MRDWAKLFEEFREHATQEVKEMVALMASTIATRIVDPKAPEYGNPQDQASVIAIDIATNMGLWSPDGQAAPEKQRCDYIFDTTDTGLTPGAQCQKEPGHEGPHYHWRKQE